MDAEKIFIFYMAGCFLVTWFGSCWIIERQMKKAKAAAEKAEEKRKQRAHDNYCAAEMQRMYAMRGRYEVMK